MPSFQRVPKCSHPGICLCVRGSISAMRVRKLPWLLAPALLLPSCTSTVPEPGQTSTTRLNVGSGEELQSNSIESVLIAGPTSLVLQVDHSSCRELVPWLSEFPDRVEVAALSSDVEGEESCSSIGVGRINPLEIDLEAPLGDRQLVLRVPEALLDGEAGIPSLCVYELGHHWCLEALVVGGDKELLVGAPRYPPTALYSSIGPDKSLALSSGTIIEMNLDEAIVSPYVFERRGIWRPDLDLWGSVGVHNISRPLEANALLDRLVAGYPAYRVTAPEDTAGAQNSVTIQVDSWFVDVVIWTKDPARQQATIDGFLDGLTIELRSGDLPMVIDAHGWIGETQDLAISDANGNGFVFNPAPNCEPAELAGCRPGSGFTSESGPFLPGQAAGVVQLSPTRQSFAPPRLVKGDVHVVSFGGPGDIVSCIGVPALASELLPRKEPLDQVRGEIQILTGITSWQARSRPGVETIFTGAVDDPEVVVTFTRNEDGTWSVTSAVAAPLPAIDNGTLCVLGNHRVKVVDCRARPILPAPGRRSRRGVEVTPSGAAGQPGLGGPGGGRSRPSH